MGVCQKPLFHKNALVIACCSKGVLLFFCLLTHLHFTIYNNTYLKRTFVLLL